MTSSQLKKKYLAWWQPLNPKGRLWPNQTGFFRSPGGERFIPCGIPTPKPRQKNSGGGSDLLGWNNGIFMARELKTKGDSLKENQADFLSLVVNCGGDAGLVIENKNSKLGFDEIIWNENMRIYIGKRI